MKDALRAANFTFRELQARHGPLWLGSRRPNRPRPSSAERDRLLAQPVELLKTFQLKGISGDAHGGLLGWLDGRYPLVLTEAIPTPREMLDCQCLGRRYVSLVPVPPAGVERPYGRHAGALEFILHDFEHGQKFFASTEQTRAQITFFVRLRSSLWRWERLVAAIPHFQVELDYLMADMNSHPLHLLKYMKAITLNAFKRWGKLNEFDPFFAALFFEWGLTGAAFEAAQRINYPEKESHLDHVKVSDFFSRAD